MRCRSLRPGPVLAGALCMVLAACGTPAPPSSPPTPAAGSPAGSPAAARHEPSPVPSQTPVSGLPDFSHIVVIVMENEPETAIIGNPDAPYLNALAKTGALATRYYAVSHPSLPNYLALVGGSTFGVTSDCSPGPGCTATDPGLADQLQAAGISWKAYMQSMPKPCDQAASGDYAVKHDPFVYFRSVVTTMCGNVVPAGQLTTDLADGSLPRFAWLSPNLCNDMHDCSVRTGDSYLAGIVPQILRALGPNGVLLVTFDEGTTDAGGGQAGAAGGQVALIAAGPAARTGVRSSAAYDHYSLLRTIEDAWGLPPLRSAGGAAPMTDLFSPGSGS